MPTRRPAQLAMVTTKLNAGGYAKIVDKVTMITTPGETVDVMVTEEGVAVNPIRTELLEQLRSQGIQLVSIEQLRTLARTHAPSTAEEAPAERRVVAIVEYRDGSVIDVVRQA